MAKLSKRKHFTCTATWRFIYYLRCHNTRRARLNHSKCKYRSDGLHLRNRPRSLQRWDWWPTCIYSMGFLMGDVFATSQRLVKVVLEGRPPIKLSNQAYWNRQSSWTRWGRGIGTSSLLYPMAGSRLHVHRARGGKLNCFLLLALMLVEPLPV